jgi:hypothetical protein
VTVARDGVLFVHVHSVLLGFEYVKHSWTSNTVCWRERSTPPAVFATVPASNTVLAVAISPEVLTGTDVPVSAVQPVVDPADVLSPVLFVPRSRQYSVAPLGTRPPEGAVARTETELVVFTPALVGDDMLAPPLPNVKVEAAGLFPARSTATTVSVYDPARFAFNVATPLDAVTDFQPSLPNW